MKINIQKVTRAIPCFMAVLAVGLASVFPVSASPYTAEDPYDYITGTEIVGAYEYISCTFDDFTPAYLITDDMGVTEYHPTPSTTNYDIQKNIVTGNDSLTIAAWPMNNIAEDYDIMQWNAIDVSSIKAGSRFFVNGSYGFKFFADYNGTLTFDVKYMAFLRCYDSQGNYLTRLNSEAYTYNASISAGTAHSVDYDCEFVLPVDCHYIIPSLKTTFNVTYSLMEPQTLSVYYSCLPFSLLIERNSIVADHQNNQAILDKLDGIMNGNPADNQDAQNGADRGDSLAGDLNQAGNALDSVPKPNVNMNDMIPSDLASESYLNLTYVIGEFWKTEVVARMMSILGCFLFLSFLLYGKKG